MAAAIALVLAGCGDDRPPAVGTAAPGGPFPVTSEHAHGRTRIEAPPERVVTVGLTDHDARIALGVVPVGVTDWCGGPEHALWPWPREALGGAEPPEVVGDAQELDLKRVAALRPDLTPGLCAAVDAERCGRCRGLRPPSCSRPSTPTTTAPRGLIATVHRGSASTGRTWRTAVLCARWGSGSPAR